MSFPAFHLELCRLLLFYCCSQFSYDWQPFYAITQFILPTQNYTDNNFLPAQIPGSISSAYCNRKFMIPIVKRTIHIFPCDVSAHPYCRPFFRRTRHLQRVHERIHKRKSHPRTVALLPCRIERLHCLRNICDAPSVIDDLDP